MGQNVRTPNGYQKNPAVTPADAISVLPADSPFQVETGTYVWANSTTGPITLLLPDASKGGEFTLSLPGAGVNDVTVQPEADQYLLFGNTPGNDVVFSNPVTSTYRATRDAASGNFGWIPVGSV